MRKYYQAILLVTAVVSVISLLFYRHEYNKLRYVLQVFNYFGKPGVEVKVPVCAAPNKTSPAAEKSFPDFGNLLSSWQRLDDDLYVYSSYSVSGKDVRTIGFTKVGNLDFDCKIYLKDSDTPITGVFSYSLIGNATTVEGREDKYTGCNLICTFNDVKAPIGVSYYRAGNEDVQNVIIAVKMASSMGHQNGSALCVSPLSIPMSKADMVSFLNYYDLVEMNHFIIYDYGISVGFHEALIRMARDPNPYWKFSYTVVPWNFPFRGLSANAIKDIVEEDCLHRTYHKVAISATVTWEEYLVPKYHRIVSDLISDFTKTNMMANRYAVQVQTFCVQQQDDKRADQSAPIVLRKTRVNPSFVESRQIYISKPREILDGKTIVTRQAPINLIAANRYTKCTGFSAVDMKPKSYESAILRFAGDMQNAQIFKKYTTHKLFGDD